MDEAKTDASIFAWTEPLAGWPAVGPGVGWNVLKESVHISFRMNTGSVDILGTTRVWGIDKGRITVFSDGAGGTMAEVGLLPFARVALQVATQVLPPYRTRFSKHQFTQPPLLAVLCLMRYEDGTFREAETRLREHHPL
jgi:hypothetical protein